MFDRKPETFPLLDIKMGNWRIIVGPCAVRLVAVAVLGIAILFFGPEMGKEVAAALRALGL